MTSSIKVLAFGMIAEKIGCSEIKLSDVRSTAELKQQLTVLYPALQGITFSIAVDFQTVSDDYPLTESSQVALLPPFSGG
jgi:molybdopterin synthase sulfur carrier subunit